MSSRRPLLTTLLFILLAVPLHATGPTGTITGTVADPSGAVVPHAKITVLNMDTNATRDARTNDDGDYTVALLPVGRYRVSAESPGFRKSFYNDVTLDVDQTRRVDFELQIGLVASEVEVKDTPPLVQTDTSTLGQVLNGRQVHELPLNERNFLSPTLPAMSRSRRAGWRPALSTSREAGSTPALSPSRQPVNLDFPSLAPPDGTSSSARLSRIWISRCPGPSRCEPRTIASRFAASSST